MPKYVLWVFGLILVFCFVMLFWSINVTNKPCKELLDDPIYPTRCKVFIVLTQEKAYEND